MISVVRHIHVRDEYIQQFLEWYSSLTATLHGQPGYIRGEIRPPDEHQSDWVVIEDFTSLEAAQSWLVSEQRNKLVDQLADMLASPESVAIIASHESQHSTGVTAVIRHRLPESQYRRYVDWQTRIQSAQAQYPGYKSIEVQPPIPGVTEDWVTLLRFDSGDNLRAWLTSPECQAFEKESEEFLQGADLKITRTDYSSWLDPEQRAEDPPSWKINAVVLLTLYPVVMLTALFVNPFLSDIGLGLVVFIGNVIGVAATGFILVPWAGRLLNTWLQPPPGQEKRITVVGSILMLLAYAVLVGFFSWMAVLFS